MNVLPNLSARKRLLGYGSLIGLIGTSYAVVGEALATSASTVLGVVASAIEITNLWNTPPSSIWVPVEAWISFPSFRPSQGDPDSDFKFTQNEEGVITIISKWRVVDLLPHSAVHERHVILDAKFQIDRPKSSFGIEIVGYSSEKKSIQIRRIF